MTETEHRPGEADRGGVDDQHRAGEVSHDDSSAGTRLSVPEQLGRRRGASLRLPPLASGRRDPWSDPYPGGWSAAELDAWAATVEHLQAQGLFAEWQVPDPVRACLGLAGGSR